MSTLTRGIVLLFLFTAPRAWGGEDWLQPFERQPLPDFTPPAVHEVVLDNGLTCFLLEDHSVPTIHLSWLTKVGNIYEAKTLTGLARLTGSLMVSGGSGLHSPEEFDRLVDDLGLTITSEIGTEMGQATLRALAADLEPALALVVDMLFAPRFDAKRLSTAKGNLLEELRREDDDPSALADRIFYQAVYGSESPWARRPTSHSIGHVTRHDIMRFHRTFFVPRNMILVATGDFSTAQLVTRLREITKAVANDEPVFPSVAPVTLTFTAQQKNLIRSLNQSFIRMGHLGIKRDNPDRFAINLMNAILGAPIFKSRLMEDIRTNRGLAYTVASSFTPTKDAGVFVVRAATKSSSTDEVMRLVAEHIQKMQQGVLPHELDFAKRSVLSQQVFTFDTAFKAAWQRALYRFYGYPDDFWRVSRTAIEHVTIKDIERVAADYLHPDALIEVVVGPGRNE